MVECKICVVAFLLAIPLLKLSLFTEFGTNTLHILANRFNFRNV